MPPRARPAKPRDSIVPGTPLSELVTANGDVESLIASTMMDAVKGAEDDIRTIMAGVKAINATKRRLRHLLSQINRDVVAATVSELEGNGIAFSSRGLGGERAYQQVEIPVPDVDSRGGVQVAVVSLVDGKIISKSQLDGAADAIKNQLDSMSELGETESLRLQMAMDRLSKLMAALSNLLKKISDTSDAIIDNMK
jgi:hypothetical protein